MNINEHALYVSPTGSDSNSGTIDQPLATLAGAQMASRRIIEQGLESNLTVYVRTGIYRIDKPLTFGPQDSGNADFAVTYRAFPGEQPVISGGVPITGWQKQSDHVWVAPLPESMADVTDVRQLYLDGTRLERTRYPQTGFLKIATMNEQATELQLEGEMPDFDLAGSEAVVVLNWALARQRVASVDGNTVKFDINIGKTGGAPCSVKPGMSIFFEDHPKLLGTAGQWHFDKAQRTLSYVAFEAQDPNEHCFVAPAAEQLLVVTGTDERPVRNLHFEGLELAHAAWLMPSIGYGGLQACYYVSKSGPTDAHNPPSEAATSAVVVSNAMDGSFRHCRMVNIGGTALGIGRRTHRNVVADCLFNDIGGNGVMTGFMPVKAPLDSDWPTKSDIPCGNEITRCRIYHCGQELWGAVGVFDAMTAGTQITHNTIAHHPYTGISVGFVWGDWTTSQSNCTIAYNEVFDVMKKVYDGGAIYTLGYQPGTVIRGNKLYAVHRSGYAFGHAENNGIFFDQASRGFLIEDNEIYDTAGTSLRFNICLYDWHTWRNNTMPEKGAEAKSNVTGITA